MKVKTDYVPEEVLFYLTPGKVYEVFHCTEWDSDNCIITDNNEVDCINPKGCAHLNFEPWEIVEENTNETI